MPRPIANNPIGESIYNRIKEYDMTSKKVFFTTISAEHKELYDKYRVYMNGVNRIRSKEDKEKSRKGIE